MGHSFVGVIDLEGFVYHGSIYHWSLGDKLHWKTKPLCCIGGVIPSLLPETTKQDAWKLFDRVVANMVKYGFDNSFVFTEVFLLQDGTLEVNPRVGAGMNPLSKAVLKDSNTLEAQINLARDIKPDLPIPNGRHALLARITTFGSGQAKDFNCGLPTLVHPDVNLDQVGHHIAWAFSCGDSRSEVLEKNLEVCHKVLLKPELSALN